MGISAISSVTPLDLTYLTQTKAASATATATASQKTRGTPPAGGGGGAKPAASASSSTSSSSSAAKIYEAADTNKDGVVSYQEALLYSVAHPADETKKQAEVSTSQLQSGLKSYQQGQQTNTTSLSFPLVSI